MVNVKGLVWYPSRNSLRRILDPDDAGRAVGAQRPIDIGRQHTVVHGPRVRGCHWVATDWIENLLLAEAGLETYDAWTFHELPFDSPPVRRAFERFGDIVFPEGSVLGGPEGAAETSIFDAQTPMFDDPPGCWLYLFPTFAAFGLPQGEAPGRSTDTFPFPSVEGQAEALIGGGEMVGAFSDRPEVRELIRWLLSPQHGVERAEAGLEFMSPHRDFDLDHYPPFLRRQAEVLQGGIGFGLVSTRPTSCRVRWGTGSSGTR